LITITTASTLYLPITLKILAGGDGFGGTAMRNAEMRIQVRGVDTMR